MLPFRGSTWYLHKLISDKKHYGTSESNSETIMQLLSISLVWNVNANVFGRMTLYVEIDLVKLEFSGWSTW